jgi:hypothetical protein
MAERFDRNLYRITYNSPVNFGFGLSAANREPCEASINE